MTKNKTSKKSDLDLSVVIPLYNEKESLPELHRQLTQQLQHDGWRYELIFIDDGSTDESAEIIADLCRTDPRCKLIQFRRNYGKSAALAAGFQVVSGKTVVTLDADLQDDPAEIRGLITKLDEGYDMVSGWKKNRQDPFIKRHSSKIYNFFTSLFSGIRLHDFNCGLKAYRLEVIRSLAVYGEMHRYLPVIAHRNGFRVTELPVVHHARKFGRSKFGSARFFRGAFDLLTITFLTRYKKRPLHLFGSLGLLSFLGGSTILLILAYQRLFHNQFLSNRPLLILGVLLIIIGIQFFSIGLLGEMLTDMKPAEDTFAVRHTIGIEQPMRKSIV
ncbi:glycosyltransferase family 2 protein [candidate division KSB1 bacterium]|nr:glycosyltransferase family 2 protein [candidate division KSB1 bacterium]